MCPRSTAIRIPPKVLCYFPYQQYMIDDVCSDVLLQEQLNCIENYQPAETKTGGWHSGIPTR
jgi:hypothetical protein